MSVQQLYQLQELDLERDKRHRRLKEILSQLVETEELHTARARVTQLEAELAGGRAQQRDLELEAQSLEAKIASVEERMYSGRVTNPKVLTDLQNDSLALRRRWDALDEKRLGVMLAIEETEARLGEAQASNSAIEVAWAVQQHSLEQERLGLDDQLAGLDHARTGSLPGIPSDELAQYEMLRRTKNGVAVALIEDGFCEACGMELSDRNLAQAIQGESLVFCGNCGRILLE